MGRRLFKKRKMGGSGEHNRNQIEKGGHPEPGRENDYVVARRFDPEKQTGRKRKAPGFTRLTGEEKDEEQPRESWELGGERILTGTVKRTPVKAIAV